MEPFNAWKEYMKQLQSNGSSYVSDFDNLPEDKKAKFREGMNKIRQKYQDSKNIPFTLDNDDLSLGELVVEYPPSDSTQMLSKLDEIKELLNKIAYLLDK